MKPVTVDIIVYGDFSARATSQAENMQPLITLLRKKNMLGRVICRGGKGREYVSAIPGGSFFPKVITALERVLKINLRFFTQNILFDFCASKKIRAPFVVASVSGLTHCLQATHKRGGKFVEFLLMENPDVFIEKIITFSRKEGVPIDTAKIQYLQQCSTTLKKADTLIAISQHIIDSFPEEFRSAEGRFFLCPLGIDTDHFRPNEVVSSEKEKTIFLSLAHFQLLKGLQYALTSWRLLPTENREFWIGGTLDGWVQSVIAKKYSQIESVSYLGNIKNPLSYYQKADFFLFLSLSEGISKALLEAMASGLPVIISHYLGLPITNGKEGYIVDPEDSEAVGRAIETMYHMNTQERHRMAERARAFVVKGHTLALYEASLEKMIATVFRYE